MIQVKSTKIMSPLWNVQFVAETGIMTLRIWDMKGDAVDLIMKDTGEESKLKLKQEQERFMQSNEPEFVVVISVP